MCDHRNLVIVTEIQTDLVGIEKQMIVPRKFVECADCKEVLNISMVTTETRYVEIHETN